MTRKASPRSSDDDRLVNLIANTYDDPDLFNSSILGREAFWAGQRAIAESVARYRITVAYTGNAVGKDYLVGSVIPWWCYTRTRSLCIATGPSQTVLGSVTWKEVRNATQPVYGRPLARIPLGAKISSGIRCSPLRLTVDGDWGALGYSTTSVERASGQHNRKLLVIVEEASGVEDEIWDALDSLKYVRLLAIGNPIRPDGRFVQLIRQAAKDKEAGIPPHRAVNAIRIASTESPDIHLEESPRGLADATWLADLERRYGRESLYFRSHVLAEIPTLSSDRLIPTEWLDRAANASRPVLTPFGPVNATRRIACDLSEGVGRDSTAICVGDRFGLLDWTAGSALGLSEAATEIARLKRKWGVPDERISYDKSGIGRDLRHYLIRNGIEAAIPYAGSGRPKDRRGYVNLRTEAAWKLRQRLNPDWSTDPHWATTTRQEPYRIPPDQQWPWLREELEKLTYDLVGNQTRLILKEDLSAELGRSPDRSDALIQLFAF